jgi:hypothetical protein
MFTITASDVNEAYVLGMTLLASSYTSQPSRDGDVLMCPEPVTTHYRNPQSRVLFARKRDANPFFHLFEALWMLTGAKDVTVPAYFVRRMAMYSDNGRDFHGAYGYRWRHAMQGEGANGFDQLGMIIRLLQHNPNDRRVILSVWDAQSDLGDPSKDIPCNTQVKFDIRDGRLCMVVFNRSNDIIMGAYGANAVQFSILQEYLAAMIGVKMGWYEQVSTNYHAYQRDWVRFWPEVEKLSHYQAPQTPYEQGIKIVPLVSHPETFDEEIHFVIDMVRRNMHLTVAPIHNTFLETIALPMYTAYQFYRNDQPELAAAYLGEVIEEEGYIDWLVAGQDWMRRRIKQEG